MNTPGALEALLAELETLGQNHDRNYPERCRRMLCITRDTGEFLAVKGPDCGSDASAAS